MADQKSTPSPETKQDDLNDVDNGFFTDDNNRLQTKEEYEEDKGNHPGKNEKVTPIEPDTTTPTLGDKISIDFNNEDLVTPVKDDDTEPYINEDDQAH
ncbi:MAG TPA: hypothetical protein VFW07_14375 [Parafilimonas sp.]|nr:hypothetical protein [Parafilimonas sp.]